LAVCGIEEEALLRRIFAEPLESPAAQPITSKETIPHLFLVTMSKSWIHLSEDK
jgi:hypothetical protein